MASGVDESRMVSGECRMEVSCEHETGRNTANKLVERTTDLFLRVVI